MDHSTVEKFETLFLALADKTRLRLLALMAGGEVPVGFLADQLGESQPKISRHLAYLRSAGLVSTRRDGKRIYYDIDARMDESVNVVLDATLRIMATRQVDERRQLLYPNGMESTVRENEENDTFTESYMIDWKPNELEIYLL